MLLRSFFTAAVSLAGLFHAGSAVACQCAMPRDHDALRLLVMEKSKHVFAGRIISVKKVQSEMRGFDVPFVEARVRVLKQIKGALPPDVIVVSWPGDDDGSCGIGDGLVRAKVSGNPYTFALDEGEVKQGRFRFLANACTSGQFDIDLSN